MVCRGNWGLGGVGGGGRIVPGSFVVAGLRLWNLRSVGFGAWSGGGGNLRSVGSGVVGCFVSMFLRRWGCLILGG